MMKFFAENVKGLNIVNILREKLDHRCLAES